MPSVYNQYLQEERTKQDQMRDVALQDVVDQRTQEMQNQTSMDSMSANAASRITPYTARMLEHSMADRNPMALSPEQLIAVKAMNQRNNSKYLYDLANKAREAGNIADSQKYIEHAKQFNKNAASLDRDSLMTRREILADDSILLRNIYDQSTLNNAVSLSELRGRPMTELLSMTDDGLYSKNTKRYIDSRIGQLEQEKDWLDVNMQVLDDETRYYDRMVDDKRTSAFNKVQARRDAMYQQNLVKEERAAQLKQEKERQARLKSVPQSYEDLIKKQKTALRNTLSDKQLAHLDRINPELATIERQRKKDLSDPIKYAESLGYDLDRDTKQIRDISEKTRSQIKALPSPDVLLQEWRAEKKKVPSEDELDIMKWHKDPMYDVYKERVSQIETIDKFVKNKYGVSLTEQDMKDPMERTIYTDETGQDITPRALIDTAVKHRISVDQVLMQLGIPYDERNEIISQHPELMD